MVTYQEAHDAIVKMYEMMLMSGVPVEVCRDLAQRHLNDLLKCDLIDEDMASDLRPGLKAHNILPS